MKSIIKNEFRIWINMKHRCRIVSKMDLIKAQIAKLVRNLPQGQFNCISLSDTNCIQCVSEIQTSMDFQTLKNCFRPINSLCMSFTSSNYIDFVDVFHNHSCITKSWTWHKPYFVGGVYHKPNLVHGVFHKHSRIT